MQITPIATGCNTIDLNHILSPSPGANLSPLETHVPSNKSRNETPPVLAGPKMFYTAP